MFLNQLLTMKIRNWYNFLIKILNYATVLPYKLWKISPTQKGKNFLSLYNIAGMSVVKLSLSFTVGKIDRNQKITFDSAYLRDMKWYNIWKMLQTIFITDSILWWQTQNKNMRTQ